MNRRNFLKTSAIASGVILTLPYITLNNNIKKAVEILEKRHDNFTPFPDPNNIIKLFHYIKDNGYQIKIVPNPVFLADIKSTNISNENKKGIQVIKHRLGHPIRPVDVRVDDFLPLYVNSYKVGYDIYEDWEYHFKNKMNAANLRFPKEMKTIYFYDFALTPQIYKPKTFESFIGTYARYTFRCVPSNRIPEKGMYPYYSNNGDGLFVV